MDPEDTRVAFDPTCGKRIRPDESIRVEARGEIRWFCSRECADKFLATPWRFEDEEFEDRSK